MTERPVALVTGASRGIGRAIADALDAAGFEVVGLARGSAGDGPRLTLACDVADLSQHDTVFARIAERFGRLDLFVSNAGVAPAERRDVLETTPESFDRVLDTNLRGAFFLAQRAARVMLAGRRTGPVQPRMVFITSVSARTASRNRVEYCVSKAGLSMVARVFAERLADDGIPVFEVRPGIIRTDMTAPVQAKYDAAIAGGLVPQRRWGEPGDVARAVVALARGDFDYATGTIIDVGGGLHLPRL